MLATTLLAAVLVFTAGDDSIVHLKDGKSVTGQVTERKGDAIDLLVDGKKRRIPRSQIDRITDTEGNVRWVDALVTSTAHYEIQSNLPRERAKELGRKLEMLYAWFFQTYEKDWRLHDVKRLKVRCTRTKREYEEHLATLTPIRPAPMAFYSTGDEALCMCDQPIPGGRSEETLFHEAGHQLLGLTANFAASPQDPHYWVTEAIPCTFEGLVEKDGKLVDQVMLARLANVRARMARGPGIHELAKLDAMTQKDYRADEYDQGFTLAWFFLKAEGGKYRKPFLRFVEDVSFTRVRPETFKKHLGRELDEFEAEWRAFVQGLPLGPAK